MSNETLELNSNPVLNAMYFSRFVVSGTWTCPNNITSIFVSGCGGGGGGGKGFSSVNGGDCYVYISGFFGGCGSSAGWSIKEEIQVVENKIYTVSIGSAGVGANGAISSTTGGDSKISLDGTDVWLAYGGIAGSNATNTANGTHGTKPPAGVGTFAGNKPVVWTHPDNGSSPETVVGGYGGGCPFGSGGLSDTANTSSACTNATGYGSGGGGGFYRLAPTVETVNGGSGGSGLIIIEW